MEICPLAVNTVGIITQAGSVMIPSFYEWMGKHWKSSSDVTVSSPLPHICWRKQESLQLPDWAAMMSLPAIRPENLLSEGCGDRGQIIYLCFCIFHVLLSDIGLEVNPGREPVHVRTSLRPAQSQDWSLL